MDSPLRCRNDATPIHHAPAAAASGPAETEMEASYWRGGTRPIAVADGALLPPVAPHRATVRGETNEGQYDDTGRVPRSPCRVGGVAHTKSPQVTHKADSWRVPISPPLHRPVAANQHPQAARENGPKDDDPRWPLSGLPQPTTERCQAPGALGPDQATAVACASEGSSSGCQASLPGLLPERRRHSPCLKIW
ncbi:hypothetical protein G7Z17_g6528 [Cylindrodendrum hubeiense]|uniref:Uncharacterized protein n=1 Tax=Cylindrodendrum hubeiense TaxID=595255 RepID=A0A9P5H571_9HYPO|nr:hypothetical protein G7Z17_g6528 [Cylindrodendrum hubeiense]